MGSIKASVGRGGINLRADVRLIQDLLNRSSTAPKPLLNTDGEVGPRTIKAIEDFQKLVMKSVKPDGRIDPGGKTFQILSSSRTTTPTSPVPQGPYSKPRLPPIGKATRLITADIERAAKVLGCEVNCIRAVTEVESNGGGFYSSGRPTILFEAHIFSRRTQHKYDALYPEISSLRWNRKLYRLREREYERLEQAMALDHHAALESASWGLFQIMGFHFAKVGFSSVEDYVTAMFESEGQQLDAFVKFLQASQLDGYLRAKRWAAFAEGYNGPGYKENQYDTKLASAYDKFRKLNPVAT